MSKIVYAVSFGALLALVLVGSSERWRGRFEAAVRGAPEPAVVRETSSTATAPAESEGSEPRRPQLFDTTYARPIGRTLAVRAGGDFQSALREAQPGDVITLEAGATFAGPFTLPRKRGDGWIVVRTSAPDTALPTPGTRIDPSYARDMPRLVASSGSAVRTAPGAHHYRFIGIAMQPRDGTFLYNLVELGSGERSVEEQPHHIIFDRCYLRGDPAKGTRRGIAMNSRYTAVVDSHLEDFKELGADSQAIGGWTGAGPFKIVNNYLEAAGENVMFGGEDPSIEGLVPSDIEIRYNHFSKPLAWKKDDPAYEGKRWTVKNLFELKNARRVLVEGNLFEHNWADAQNGFAILFTVRNQNGKAPWSAVQDVTFASNILRGATAGLNMHGRDAKPSEQTRRVLIANNLFLDVGHGPWGEEGRLFQILNGTADVVIEHNTSFHTGNIVTAEGPPSAGFAYRNNIAPHNDYGIIGTGRGVGHSSLDAYFPRAEVRGNVFIGGNPAHYPPGNFFVASLDEVGFVDPAARDYRLAESSPYRERGTDGRDPGVDFAALRNAMKASSSFSSVSELLPEIGGTRNGRESSSERSREAEPCFW